MKIRDRSLPKIHVRTDLPKLKYLPRIRSSEPKPIPELPELPFDIDEALESGKLYIWTDRKR